MTDGASRQDFERLENKVDEIAKAVAELKALQRTEAERCPHREALARAGNGLAHLAKLEERVNKQERAIAALADLPKLEARVDQNSKEIEALKLSWAKLLALMIASSALGGALSGPLAGLLAALGN